MNSLVSLMCWLASVNAWSLSFLGANVPDLNHGVDVSLSRVSFDQTNGVFVYSYRFGNPSTNSGGLSSIDIDISQPPGGVVFSSAALGPDVRFLRKSANRMLASGEVNIVPIAVESPLNWLGDIGLGNLMGWSSDDLAFDIAPSSSLAGFIIRSPAPPGPRSFFAEPFLDTDMLPEDQFGGDTAENAVANTDALMAQLKVKGTTLGPTPPASLEPSSLIDNLISLKHQAVSLGWLFGPGADGIAKSLDAKLNAAKDSAGRGDTAAAANQLGAFINELDAQRGKHLNDNAYFLLKPNAQFIIGKLKP